MSQVEAASAGAHRLLFDHAPRGLSLLTFLAGVVSLVWAANPGAAPADAVVELSNFGAAAGGVAFMALSAGLRRRVRLAYVFTLLFAVHGAVLAVFAKQNVLALIIFGGLAAVLVAARKAFFRRSALASIRLGRFWFLSAGLAVALAAIGAVLWAGHSQGFIAASWWDLVVDPALGVAGRPVAFAAGLIALGGFATLVAAPTRPPAPAPSDDDFARFDGIAAEASDPRPESQLAYSGDMSFLYSASGRASLMYAPVSNALIAMGAPVGPRQEWRGLLSAFRDEAERLAARAAIYAAPPELLPDLLDLGFKVEKIGENAILDLARFTLSGRKRDVIRRGRRKLAERAGATFEMRLPPHEVGALDDLKPVSDAWLADHGGAEKAFSLGRFEPAFLARCPVGVVRLGGRIAAFGTLLAPPGKGWVGIDLMRYDPEAAVTNTMDFLLVELILWAKEEGYKRFDLAMAPLSGLVEAEYAPLFARVGRVIFDRGERFYNFQGLRRFKQKFDPEWEPRYVAAPGYFALPVALAEAAYLTNGRRPAQRAEEPA